MTHCPKNTPREVIKQGQNFLKGYPNGNRMCEILLSELLNRNRTALYLEETPVAEGVREKFFEVLQGLYAGFPLQHLLERAYFMGESFWVTPDCLIPRPETETLVEASFEYLQNEEKNVHQKGNSLSLIEIGTGSGCLAIALTKKLKSSKIWAIDLMEKALRVAQKNGQDHGVSDRVTWLCGDLLTALRKTVEVDAILSNPPYVASEEMSSLPPDVCREPRTSLEGGKGGMTFFKRIALEATPFLRQGGLLFLEVGEGQAPTVVQLFLKNGFYHLETRNDILGIPRVVVFRKGRHG